MKRNFVVAVTGASGSVYALRLVEVLRAAGCDVQLTISRAAAQVMRQELGLEVDLDKFDLSMLMLEGERHVEDEKLDRIRALAGISSESSSVLSFPSGEPGEIHYHHHENLTSPIASGSFLTSAMIICPCSCGTLSAVVHGASQNLIHRAAEVHLKERRPLILVPRETPLSITQLDNMQKAARAGALILPAMPGFYHGVTGVQDLVDFVVARICDQLRIDHFLIKRWGSK